MTDLAPNIEAALNNDAWRILQNTNIQVIDALAAVGAFLSEPVRMDLAANLVEDAHRFAKEVDKALDVVNRARLFAPEVPVTEQGSAQDRAAPSTPAASATGRTAVPAADAPLRQALRAAHQRAEYAVSDIVNLVDAAECVWAELAQAWPDLDDKGFDAEKKRFHSLTGAMGAIVNALKKATDVAHDEVDAVHGLTFRQAAA